MFVHEMGNKLPSHYLSDEAVSDLERRTQFTEDELHQFYGDFKRECPHGRLSKSDFMKVYKKSFPAGDATAFTEHVFRVFDINRDGSVDFLELMVGMGTLAKGSVDQKLVWVFTIYDINRNGFISKAEMLKILQALFKMVGKRSNSCPLDESTPEKKLDKIFRNVDRNCDGQISLREFLEASKRDPQIMSCFSLDCMVNLEPGALNLP